jgi:NADH pyrophosphatase NudC (nudix superfamily)
VTEALAREGEEELGIDTTGARFLYRYIWNNEMESEYIHTFSLIYTDAVCFKTGELMNGKFFTLVEVEDMIAAHKTTPNLDHEIQLLKERGCLHY